MTERFKLPVKVGASGDNTLNVTTVQFGDGYKSKMANGINSQTAEWSVSMTGDTDKIKPFTDFIKRHEGIAPFYWTPPLEEEGLFTVEGWKTDTLGAGIYTVSAIFQSTSMAGNQSDGATDGGTVMIDDNSTVKDKTWSSAKIQQAINDATGGNATASTVKTVNNNQPDTKGNITLTYTDVGAEKSGAAAAAIAALKKEDDPFQIYAKKTAIPDIAPISDKVDTLSKAVTEIDADVTNLQDSLAETNDYVKEVHAENDAQSLQIASLADGISNLSAQSVKSINNNKPDQAGNVVLINDKEAGDNTAFSGTKVNALIKSAVDAIEKPPTITVTTTIPTDSQGKNGDIWLVYGE